MAEGDMPGETGLAVRWVIGGIALFVFFLLCAEDINEGKTGLALMWAGLFLLSFLVLLNWHRLFGPKPTHVHHHHATVSLTGVQAQGEVGSVTAEASRPIERDIWLQDAVARALYGHWPGEKEKIFGNDGDLSRMDQITQRMQALAHEGEILIWGKSTPQSLHKAIPKDFWENNQIEFMSLWGPPTTARTESVLTDSSPIFRELMVSKAQIEEQWPPK